MRPLWLDSDLLSSGIDLVSVESAADRPPQPLFGTSPPDGGAPCPTHAKVLPSNPRRSTNPGIERRRSRSESRTRRFHDRSPGKQSPPRSPARRRAQSQSGARWNSRLTPARHHQARERQDPGRSLGRRLRVRRRDDDGQRLPAVSKDGGASSATSTRRRSLRSLRAAWWAISRSS